MCLQWDYNGVRLSLLGSLALLVSLFFLLSPSFYFPSFAHPSLSHWPWKVLTSGWQGAGRSYVSVAMTPVVYPPPTPIAPSEPYILGVFPSFLSWRHNPHWNIHFMGITLHHAKANDHSPSALGNHDIFKGQQAWSGGLVLAATWWQGCPLVLFVCPPVFLGIQ